MPNLKALVDHLIANPDVTVGDLNAIVVEYRPIDAALALKEFDAWGMFGKVQAATFAKGLTPDLVAWWTNLVEKLKLLAQSGMAFTADAKFPPLATQLFAAANIADPSVSAFIELFSTPRTLARQTFGDDVTPELVATATDFIPAVTAINAQNDAVEATYAAAKEDIQSAVELVNAGDAKGAAAWAAGKAGEK